MKTLRDTATLVVLILLALTVRVETPDASSPISLATPVHAAAEQTPDWEFEPVMLPNTELETQPQTVIDAVPELSCPIEFRRVVRALPEVDLVWELAGTRVVIVLGDDEPSAPPSEPAPCDPQRVRTSC